MYYFYSLCLVLTVLSLASGVPAAETAPGRYRLGEVVVAADRELPLGAYDRIDEAVLRASHRDDLVDALEAMPGVIVARTGARNERTLFVRGFDVKHVPLFMDGIPIYSMYDGYSDFGRFTTFDISRIALSRGAASVLYGPNTMGGAINVITKRPENPFEANGGTGTASGGVTTVYGNVGTHQGPWYLQGGGSYVDRGDFKLSHDFKPSETEGGGDRDNSSVTDRKVSLKVGYQPFEGDEYAVSYSVQEAEKESPTYTGDDPSERPRYWRWPQWDKRSLYFNSKTTVGSYSYIKTRLYGDAYDNSLFSYDDATYTTQARRSSFRSWHNDDTLGGALEVGTRRFDGHTLKSALHYKRDRHREHDAGEPVQTLRDEYYSAAVEDTILLSDAWSMLAGMSYDWQVGLEAQDFNGDTGEMYAMETEDTGAFNPQVSLFYDVQNTGLAYLSMARKSRLPTLKDRYSYRLGRALPNPGLDPERSTNYEVGYEGDTEILAFKGALFLSDIEDYIQAVTMPDPERAGATLEQNRNVGEVLLYGAEGQLIATLPRGLRAGLGYTYTQWDNRSGSDKITGVPAHKITTYAHSPLGERAGLTVSAEYTSGRYSTSDGVRETHGFTLVDIRADCTLFAGFKLDVGVDNVFDTNYAAEEGYPEAGASYSANLSYRY